MIKRKAWKTYNKIIGVYTEALLFGQYFWTSLELNVHTIRQGAACSVGESMMALNTAQPSARPLYHASCPPAAF